MWLQRIALGALVGGLGLALGWMLLTAPGARASACGAQDNYIGAPAGAWNVEGNWSNKLPTASESVCIREGVGSIEVPTGYKAEAKTLVAQSAVKIASTGTLAIEEATGFGGTTSAFSGLDLEAGGHLSTAGGWIDLSGTVLVEGEISRTQPVEALVRLVSGTLSGNGTIAVQFNNQGGTLQPGGAGVIGTLHLTMLSSQSTGGTLVLDIASATSFDRLAIGSNFGPAGTLDVNLLGGYEPSVATQFRFISGGGGMIGEFETITPGFTELQEPNEDTIVVSPRKPTAVTEAATEVTQTSAVLNASVNPNTEQVTICDFEFGTSEGSYGSSSTCPTPPGKGSAAVAETKALSSLTPGTTYHYRIVAVNGDGQSTGADRSFTTLPASTEPKGGEETKTGGETKTPAESKTGSETNTGAQATTGAGSGGAGVQTTSPKVAEELLLGCSKAQLVLNDVLIHGGRVALEGSAAKSLDGKTVKILFDGSKQVATATVGASGQFSTTAPLPPARLRARNNARYLAESGSERSLNLKLTRRLSLEPPKDSGGTVTLVGQVVPPLSKPIAAVTVEQQLECGKTTVVDRFTPPASGRFSVSFKVPAGATAAVYRLRSSVAQSPGSRHAFATYSLPLPVILG